MSKVHDLFVGFLDNTEMNGLPAFQRAARLREYRSALKAKGPPRPSFIDTGTYQAAMRAPGKRVLNAFLSELQNAKTELNATLTQGWMI